MSDFSTYVSLYCISRTLLLFLFVVFVAFIVLSTSLNFQAFCIQIPMRSPLPLKTSQPNQQTPYRSRPSAHTAATSLPFSAHTLLPSARPFEKVTVIFCNMGTMDPIVLINSAKQHINNNITKNIMKTTTTKW